MITKEQIEKAEGRTHSHLLNDREIEEIWKNVQSDLSYDVNNLYLIQYDAYLEGMLFKLLKRRTKAASDQAAKVQDMRDKLKQFAILNEINLYQVKLIKELTLKCNKLLIEKEEIITGYEEELTKLKQNL